MVHKVLRQSAGSIPTALGVPVNSPDRKGGKELKKVLHFIAYIAVACFLVAWLRNGGSVQGMEIAPVVDSSIKGLLVGFSIVAIILVVAFFNDPPL